MDDDHINLHQKLCNLLFVYRNATHATTNQTPAMLFLGRRLRSRLDLLQPNSKRTVQDRQMQQAKRACDRKLCHFAVGQTVLARSYRGHRKWVPATVKEWHSPLSYTVKVASGAVWWRHVYQLRTSGLTFEDDLSVVSTSAEKRGQTAAPESSAMDCLLFLHRPLTPVPKGVTRWTRLVKRNVAPPVTVGLRKHW